MPQTNIMPKAAYFLTQAAHHSPSPDNSQPWKLIWQNNVLSVGYDTLRVADKTFPADSHATLLAIGALLENLTQAAAALNINLAWTFPEILDVKNPIYFQAKIEQSDIEITSTIDSIPLFKRHTNRFPYRDRPLNNEIVSLLKNMTQDNARILVFDNETQIRQAAAIVRAASEIRFQIRETHEWLGKSLRFNSKSTDQNGEGLDVATIDLPPGGGLFLRWISDWRRMCWLNKVGAYKAMALIDSKPISKAPAIIAVVGPNRFRDTLAAGQLMNRAWIALNSDGVAAHPYYVIADQLQRRQANSVPLPLAKQADAIFEQSRQLFQLRNEETLHMLFRAGYPKTIPTPSKRLPLKTVCSGIQFDKN